MATDYCTATDVVDVAVKYKDVTQGFVINVQNISTAQIETLIAEASLETIAQFHPFYKLDVIDGYSPDYPPLIVYTTKIYAAILLYDRFGSANQDIDRAVIDKLYIEYQRCVRNIQGGFVYSVAGDEVTRNLSVMVYQGEDSNFTEVLNGPRH